MKILGYKVAKTIGDTTYTRRIKSEFSSSSLLTGKKPELCETSTYPRKTKEILVRELRVWQKLAFNSLKNSTLLLVKAFCGSGKTTLSVVMALYDLIFAKRRGLFIVPQSHIGDGFCVSGIFNIPGIGRVHLGKKPIDFCDDSDSKTDMLVEFLRASTNYDRLVSTITEKREKQYVVDGSNAFAVATHQCFVAAINQIIKREENGEEGLLNKCLINLGLYIDEAHHIKSGSSKEELKEENTYNRLGRILEIILQRSEINNTRVSLTTATFFRGDQGIIVSSENLKRFNRYELEFLDHFDTLEIENVFVNFEEYKTDPIKQIVKNIEKELHERHLIIVPTGGKIGAKWRKTDVDLSRLKNELRKMLLRNGLDPDLVVLDLVDKEIQKHNKSILLKEPKEAYDKDETKNSKIRIVITCMLGREGTDWCPCSRLHNASIELGSTTLAVQTLGRLFRKFKGKNKVGVTYYIKNFDSLESSSKKREYISNRVNAMLALMLIDDLMNPIMLPELPTTAHDGCKRAYSKKKKKCKTVRLSDVYDYEDFEEIQKEIALIQSCQLDFQEKSTEEIIKSVICKYKKKAHVDDSDIVAGFKVFLLRARSEALRSRGIDISYVREAGFDEIIEEYKLEGNFWAGILTGDKFRKFQKIIGKIFWTNKQHEEIKNNIMTVLSKKLERKIVESNKSDELIIRKTVRCFCDFHNVYNKVSTTEGSLLPSLNGVATELKVSITVLREKIRMLNQIAPIGYKFFDKKSKITEKFSPAA